MSFIFFHYDVRAYYQPSNTYADDQYIILFGLPMPKQSDSTNCATSITEFDLDSYPNPFNPATTIQYQLPEDGNVSIKIYNSLGKEVKTICNEYKQAGVYSSSFDAVNMPSGIYFAVMRANAFTATKKLLFIK